MANCYKCEALLISENFADEHVILNACGGRLKSKDLLCKTCNSTFGSTCDAELAKQTNILSNQLLITRENGKPQNIDGTSILTGEKVKIPYNKRPYLATPVVSQEVNGDKIKLSIQARDKKQMNQIQAGLKRKYPNLNPADMQKYESAVKLDGFIHISNTIGGDLAFRSIAKSAINFFLIKGGDRNYIKHLLSYIGGQEKFDDIVWMHYPDKSIYTPEDNEVSHIIRLIGNSHERILYAYIELFNAHNYLIKLNDVYNGLNYDETYIYNLISQKEMSAKIIPINYTRKQVLDFINNKIRPYKEVQKKFTRVIGIAQQRQTLKYTKKDVN